MITSILKIHFCLCVCTHAEVRGQLVGVSSPFTVCVPGVEPGLRLAVGDSTLAAEPSQPHFFLLRIFYLRASEELTLCF